MPSLPEDPAGHLPRSQRFYITLKATVSFIQHPLSSATSPIWYFPEIDVLILFDYTYNCRNSSISFNFSIDSY